MWKQATYKKRIKFILYDDIDLEQRSIVDQHAVESTMDFQNEFNMPSVKEVLGLEPS